MSYEQIAIALLGSQAVIMSLVAFSQNLAIQRLRASHARLSSSYESAEKAFFSAMDTGTSAIQDMERLVGERNAIRAELNRLRQENVEVFNILHSTMNPDSCRSTYTGSMIDLAKDVSAILNDM
jgi:hypothetical protein